MRTFQEGRGGPLCQTAQKPATGQPLSPSAKLSQWNSEDPQTTVRWIWPWVGGKEVYTTMQITSRSRKLGFKRSCPTTKRQYLTRIEDSEQTLGQAFHIKFLSLLHTLCSHYYHFQLLARKMGSRWFHVLPVETQDLYSGFVELWASALSTLWRSLLTM